MTSWRAAGSILEAPGLDFEGSGDDFSRLSHVFWHVASKMSLQYSLQKSLQRSLPCWSSRYASKGENLPSYKTSASNRWASTFEDANTKNAKNAKNAKSQELYHNGREQKGGAAVVPPWGSSISCAGGSRTKPRDHRSAGA